MRYTGAMRKFRDMCRGGGDAVYGLGLLGALLYFLQRADSIGAGLYGIIKALLWPAFLIYKALEMMHF